MRRAAYLCVLLLASVRMRFADRLCWRDWLRFCLEGLGLFARRAERTIWVHGEGMGEFNAAAELVERLRHLCPAYRFIFSTSRLVTCRWLAAKYPEDVCVPPPWDIAFAVSAFFRKLRPRLLILLEFHDGFCPGALRQARRRGISVVVVNARGLHALKPLRFKVADRLGLVRQTASWIDLFCAQDEVACSELMRIGVPEDRVRLTGNLKYDRPAPGGASTRAALGIPEAVPVLVAGCVHEDEEAIVLRAFRRLRERHPHLFLVLAPHDLGRMPALERSLRMQSIPYALRSQPTPASEATVLLLDCVGELAGLYDLATVVLLGGSFTPQQAGHSLAEPAAHGKPIVLGPYVCSQQPMVETFLQQNAALQRPAHQLVETLDELLASASRRESLGQKARDVVVANAGATERTVAALQPVLPVNDEALPQSSPWKDALKSLATTTLGEWMLSTRSHRVGSLSELSRRLGDPQTILCLGNGPSSEDERLRSLHHDCLFRVNWRWRQRGFLDRPDVVFTGDRESLRRLSSCIFGFRTIAEETSMLLHTFCDRRLHRIEHFTWERLSDSLDERHWGARPTNGAVMIACAAALQPRRLVVAGIDLFRHPAGVYPGDTVSANLYAAMHDRDVELAILRHALDRYRGELIVIGDVLKRALAA